MIVTGQQGDANEINEHSSMKTPTKTQLLILVSGRLHYLQEVGTILSPHLKHDSVLEKSIVSFILLYPTVHILTLILLTWTKWRVPTNASKWRMGFNSAFKGLKSVIIHSKHLPVSLTIFLGYFYLTGPDKTSPFTHLILRCF